MSQPYKEYHVVNEREIDKLEKKVNYLLSEGWEIAGNLTVANPHGISLNYQPMGLPANAPTHLEKEPNHDHD